MYSCLSGGGRAYGFDLEIVKTLSSSPRTSQTSSPPTSTISESSNSPHSISTRKSRTPRKRPNQTYNEAAALLSRAYPRIFPVINPHEFSKLPCEFFLEEPEFSDLFLPLHEIDGSSNFTPIRDKPRFQTEVKHSPSGEIQSKASNVSKEVQEDFDFDAESIILDEEIDEGIDSIMGNLDNNEDSTATEVCTGGLQKFMPRWELGLGIGSPNSSIRAWKRAEELSYWWNFPTVDVLEISPKLSSTPKLSAEKKKKKTAMTTTAAAVTKKKSEKKAEKMKSLSELRTVESPKEEATPQQKPGLMLKLDYDGVLGAWSGKGSPFSDEAHGSESLTTDVSVRLAQIDLFSGTDIVREASVLRYKEKRRTRLFSKKIRYQVRKVNADQRPRMKGRFVRGATSDQR
ncbi:hypothetical protein SAY87_029751 [Trapa incisa]|uniref:CCT domain-containing protein n=1 Tax=Trapa incisa TaxID=236973 RepID=A0AAN7Q9E9_9MYRT|nr:hypothetical protein SAY87_029751 [Trapa incisa]